ncbi:MAG: hypothetical protein H6834_17185 [Planctomycetes bacterium]|nr:hypothetical protein [Planctomycetota bacterium]MCB9892109.1 hypothetical protein [Planctomycetota bacterium]
MTRRSHLLGDIMHKATIAAFLTLSTTTLVAQTPPLVLEPNRGQSSADCEFLARAAGATIFLRGGAAEIQQEGRTTTLSVIDALPRASLECERVLPGHTNYLIGNDPKQWVRNVPHAASLFAREVRPGVDLRWSTRDGKLEYDFLLAAGVDPSTFRLRSSVPVRVDDAGRLLQGTGPDALVHEAPVAWQEKEGERCMVEVHFTVPSSNEFGFIVGEHDPALPLVIDPVLAFVTYLGGTDLDYLGDCDFDSAGNAIVCGTTHSLDFPTRSGQSGNGTADVFVAKLSADGSSLLWCTFLGGSNGVASGAYGLAVDVNDRLFLSGTTQSNDFPVTGNAWQSSFGGVADGFVAVLTSDGTSLDYATYLGGADIDGFNGVAIHEPTAAIPVQIAYVTGHAYPGFPTTPTAFSSTSAGYGDVVLACLAIPPTGTGTLLYGSYIGGGNGDDGYSVAVDESGLAHLAGVTNQMRGQARFPTTSNAFHTGAEASRKSTLIYTSFYACMDPLGIGSVPLVYSTILENGNGFPFHLDIAVDANGRAHVSGNTGDKNYPVTANALQDSLKGSGDAFLTVIDPSLSGPSSLIYSTFLGGTGSEGAYGVALAGGFVYLAGVTSDPGTKRSTPFPTTNDAFQSVWAGGWDAFAVKLDITAPPAQQIVYSTLLGGTGYDETRCLAVSPTGSMLVAGVTHSVDLPVTGGLNPAPFDPTFNGSADVFLFRID